MIEKRIYYDAARDAANDGVVYHTIPAGECHGVILGGNANADLYVTVKNGYGMATRRGAGHGGVVVVGSGLVSAERLGKGDGHAINKINNGNGNSKQHYCVAIRKGDGAGNAERWGNGNGNAVRDGKGTGDAIRRGAGFGDAVRDGVGRGNALREGKGRGSAERKGGGPGFAIKRGEGDGNSIYSGSGVNGCALRKIGGKGDVRLNVQRADYMRPNSANVQGGTLLVFKNGRQIEPKPKTKRR